jgi:hypothetical protein
MGYVVSVPHYENAAKVREALEDFTKHYLLSREVAASGEPFQHATIYWDQAQA